MDNLIYTLLLRIQTLIAAHANVIAAGATVGIGQLNPLVESALPFIGVFYEGDVVVGENGPMNLNFQDWDVMVGVEIARDADATTTSLEQDYLNLRADVHNAIMADAPTLSQNFVEMAYPLGADEPNLDSSGKRKTVSYKTHWMFRIRTALADMTT